MPFWRYGLRAAAADLAARLGVGGAGPASGQLGDDGLVHDRAVFTGAANSASGRSIVPASAPVLSKSVVVGIG